MIDITEKPLPSSHDAEKSILGAILIDSNLMSQTQSLRFDEFYSPLHRRIFKAMSALHERQERIDPVMLGEELKRDNSLEAVGGISAVAGLCIGIPFFTDITKYVRIVQDKATLRQLIKVCAKGAQSAMSEDASLDSVLESVRSDMSALHAAGIPTGHFRSLAEIMDGEVRDALGELREGRINRYPTGFAALDNLIGGGLSPSDVVVVASQTGGGKSAFVLQMASNLAREGIPVAFVSGEMTDKENGLRLLSQMSGTYNLNTSTHISGEDHDFLLKWVEACRTLPIWFDSTTFDLMSIRRAVRGLVDAHGVKVLIVDYLQLFKTDKTASVAKRSERIAEVSQEVKRLGMEFGVAVVEVVQFNREGVKSGKPQLTDLEGSSQLEKDASVVAIIDRDEDGGEGITIRIVKGRNSPKSELRGKFTGWNLRFEL